LKTPSPNIYPWIAKTAVAAADAVVEAMLSFGFVCERITMWRVDTVTDRMFRLVEIHEAAKPLGV